jgi:D-3-phosphoglycerate dehydrogenase / 2-oxoglutarate reductase
MPNLPVLFVDHPLADAYRGLFEGLAIPVGPTDADLATADGVIAGAARPWNAAAFALGSDRLKVISRTGIGYDNVDLAAAATAGVVVCNAPEAPSVSTAEHTLALMFAITKRIPNVHQRANQGLTGEPVLKAIELDGATLGLVGFGRIARRVAAAARAIGMQVVAYDPYVHESSGEVTMCSLADLFAQSDVVSLHAPANADTTNLISTDTLSRMKQGSYLVNCARGSLVDQDALLEALESGRLAGAALDVTSPEPLPADHRLLNRPDVIVTPHVASSTVAGRRRLYEHAIDNALNVLAGKPATVVT